MSRFDFKQPPPLAKVVAAEGEDHEVTFEVPTPVGKFWTDTSLELLELVNRFEEEYRSTDNGAQATVSSFGTLIKNKSFWTKLLPSVLGVKGEKEEKQAMAYLQGALTSMQIIELFMEAAGEIVTYSFKGKETEEALAKSEGDEAAGEGEQDQNSDGTTPPV